MAGEGKMELHKTSIGKALLKNYHAALNRNPLRTKMITSAIIATLGEIIATSLSKRKRDLRRTLAFLIYGGAITGPVFHWWYGWLERTCKNIKNDNTKVVAKVLLDRLLITPPFSVLTLFILQYLQTFKGQKSWQNMKANFKTTLTANWKVWTIPQLVNFKYIPPDYRVLFGNLVALWWNIYLSKRQ